MTEDPVYPSPEDEEFEYVERRQSAARGDLLPYRDPLRPAEEQGLFRKFDVRRIDGSETPGGRHYGCRYFVLDIDHDVFARAALSAYALACEATHPDLAHDLREKWGALTPANSDAPIEAPSYPERSGE